MDNSSQSLFVIEGLVLSMGVMLILWGLWLWHKPDPSSLDSRTYRRISFWSALRQGKPRDSVQPTGKEIKIYAVAVVIGGIIVVILAMMALLR